MSVPTRGTDKMKRKPEEGCLKGQPSLRKEQDLPHPAGLQGFLEEVEQMGKERIVVGMSGGVDSSVAAHLLLEQGYEVIGVTMLTASPGDPGNEAAVGDARRVASALGIEHHTVDFSEVFGRCVMDYLAEEYISGRTPNPCIVCNRRVKWESLLKKAGELGADLIATGHYARILELPTGRLTLKMGGDSHHAKDQTYVLYQLTQEQLRHTRMPLGACSKDRIRSIASSIGLPVADKPDSQEICFIPDGDYASFICRHTGYVPREGRFVDEEGRVLGTHRGLIHYTIGQRRGLGLALGRRTFVKELRPETDEVVLSDEEALFGREVRVRRLCFMGIPELPPDEKMHVFARIRYNHRAASAIMERTGEDEILCTFDEPVRAITPGQGAVFYIDDWIACGGTMI